MVKLQSPWSQAQALTTSELVSSNLAYVIEGAQERKRTGALLHPQQARANLDYQVLLLRHIFWGCVPTFLDNEESIKKFVKLLEVCPPSAFRTQTFQTVRGHV